MQECSDILKERSGVKWIQNIIAALINREGFSERKSEGHLRLAGYEGAPSCFSLYF